MQVSPVDRSERTRRMDELVSSRFLGALICELIRILSQLEYFITKCQTRRAPTSVERIIR